MEPHIACHIWRAANCERMPFVLCDLRNVHYDVITGLVLEIGRSLDYQMRHLKIDHKNMSSNQINQVKNFINVSNYLLVIYNIVDCMCFPYVTELNLGMAKLAAFLRLYLLVSVLSNSDISGDTKFFITIKISNFTVIINNYRNH